jgi:hypothetical protein
MNDNDWWYLVEATMHNLNLIGGDLTSGSLGYGGKHPLKAQLKQICFDLRDDEYELLNPNNFNFKSKKGLKAWTHAWAECAKKLRQRSSGYNSRSMGLANALKKAAEMREKSNAVWMGVGPAGGVKTRVRGEWKAPTPLPSEKEWLAALPKDDNRKSEEPNLYNWRTERRWRHNATEGKNETYQIRFNYWYRLEEHKYQKMAREWNSFSKGLFKLNRNIPLPDWEYINAFVHYDPTEKRVEIDQKKFDDAQKTVNDWNDPDFVEEFRLKQLGWAERNRDQAQQTLDRSIETARRNKKALEDLS